MLVNYIYLLTMGNKCCAPTDSKLNRIRSDNQPPITTNI